MSGRLGVCLVVLLFVLLTVLVNRNGQDRTYPAARDVRWDLVHINNPGPTTWQRAKAGRVLVDKAVHDQVAAWRSGK